MYGFGCAATLIITFSMLALFANSRELGPKLITDSARQSVRFNRGLLAALRAGALISLLITVLSGFIGGANPAQNIGMTLFWVVFMQGFAYSSVVVGNLYVAINPWRSLIACLEMFGADLSSTRFRVRKAVHCWPAFGFYVGLIGIELFAAPEPLVVSRALLTYSAVTIIGAFLYGKDIWFHQFDVFERLFLLIGQVAPFAYKKSGANDAWYVALRPPLTGCLGECPTHISEVLFILFMLSSTTYDGIHETVMWISLFWTNLLAIYQSMAGSDLGKAQNVLIGWYEFYQYAGLVAFPLLYWAFYAAVLLLTEIVTGPQVSIRTLSFRFANSLIPIAIAYNCTHYFTMLVTQAINLPCLLSDPLDRGWNSLHERGCTTASILPMGIIWHLQVALLLGGHVAGVLLAHWEAGRIFTTRRVVVLSQAPIVLLMVAYTVFGLWILALPLGR
jgi:hypothetical protein